MHHQKAAYGKCWLKTWEVASETDYFFFLLPSEDGDLLHSQLFWETAGKIHFLFCWVPSKPHGWPSSVLWWSPSPSASWEPPLSQMLCFLLIITPQKLGYVLFIIHSFFFLTPPALTSANQPWISFHPSLPELSVTRWKMQPLQQNIFSSFLPKSLLLCFILVSSFLFLPCL